MFFDVNVVQAAMVMIVCDIMTGFLGALREHSVKSAIIRIGGRHKLGSLCAIVFGFCLDYVQTLMNLNIGVEATKMICTYIVFMEIISCIENIKKAFPGVLPKALTDMLESKASEKGVDISDEVTDESEAE